MVFTIYDVMKAGMNKTMTTDVNKTKFWSIKQIFYNDHMTSQSTVLPSKVCSTESHNAFLKPSASLTAAVARAQAASSASV